MAAPRTGQKYLGFYLGRKLAEKMRGIRPTPVPELARERQDALKRTAAKGIKELAEKKRRQDQGQAEPQFKLGVERLAGMMPESRRILAAFAANRIRQTNSSRKNRF